MRFKSLLMTPRQHFLNDLYDLIWDLNTFTCIKTLNEDDYNTIKIWNVNDNSLINTFEGHNGCVNMS
jgi:WD40 repeat protein